LFAENYSVVKFLIVLEHATLTGKDWRIEHSELYTVSQKNCANLFFAPCLSSMNRFQ